MELLNIITIKSNKYIQADELFEHAPIFCKKSRSTRALIKNKKVGDDDWVFAKKSQTTEGKWKLSDGLSAKCDKVFIRYEYVMDINEIQKKYNPEEVVLNDDEISEAPSIIDLDDCEKFKDVDGNPLDIETRGERKSDGIFFKVSDVSIAFDMPNLQKSILRKERGYINENDYKYFSCKKRNNDVNKTSKKTKVENNLFLTYEGILRVLFTSRNNKTTSFVSWATKTLFIAHMGTKEQKQLLSSDLLGVDAQVIKQVLNKDANTLPCVYLFTFNTVKELRESMNIGDKHKDDSIVCKFGFTKDLPQRTAQHQKKYEKINNVNLRLKHYAYMDPQYMSKGETYIKDCINTFNMKLDYENCEELIILPKEYEQQIKEKFTFISQNYSGHISELITKIKNMENENIILQKDIIHEQQNVQMEKQNTKLALKDNELLQKDVELLKLQIAESK
jgi:hypothetical protein